MSGSTPMEDAALIEVLTRIDTKLDAALNRGEDHEGRLRALERKLWLVSGGFAVLGGVFGQLSPLLTK